MKYAAFFKGINVGGRNKVKMEELRNLLDGLGFGSVKSYIQSGNAVFSSDVSQESLSGLISSEFEKRFGFASAVVIRSGLQLAEIASCKPFGEEAVGEATLHNPDVEHCYVYLSETLLDRKEIEKAAVNGDGDLIHLKEREIYLLCRGSIRDSKAAEGFAKLKTPLTARNMKTIDRVLNMLG